MLYTDQKEGHFELHTRPPRLTTSLIFFLIYPWGFLSGYNPRTSSVTIETIIIIGQLTLKMRTVWKNTNGKCKITSHKGEINGAKQIGIDWDILVWILMWALHYIISLVRVLFQHIHWGILQQQYNLNDKNKEKIRCIPQCWWFY